VPVGYVSASSIGTSNVRTTPAHAATDKLLLTVVCKPETAVPSSDTGSLVGSVVLGGGAAGLNTGPARLTVWEVVDDTNTVTQFSFTLTGANAQAAQALAFSKAADEVWEPCALQSGDDLTSDTAYSMLTASGVGQASGDGLALLTALGNSSASVSAVAASAPGASQGAPSERQDGGSSSGDGVRLHVATALVTAGEATGATTVTATLSAASTGGTAVVRLRALPGTDYQEAAPTGTVAAGNWTPVGAATLHEALAGTVAETGRYASAAGT
jgi:MSHA biogenesis protein MshQ